MKEIESDEPMNLNVQKSRLAVVLAEGSKCTSGEIMLVMCANSAGKCDRDLVSARKTTLVGSYGEGGFGGKKHCRGGHWRLGHSGGGKMCETGKQGGGVLQAA